MSKYTALDDALYEYMQAHRGDAGDPVLRELRQETEAMGDISRMQIAGDQGAFMQLLVAATGAKHCVEVGTFTGYSAICIARGLPDGGHLHCFDVSEQYTSVARRYWDKAGVADRITLNIGPGVETLPKHCPQQVDFAFLDADKTGYDAYYEFLLPRTRPGGLLVFDNMLAGGRVIDEGKQDENTRAIRALNDKLARDDRVESVLVAIADGLHICRKK